MSNWEWVIVWTVCAILAWIIAARKGRSGFIFFVTSVCLTPLVGVTAAILAKSIKKRKVESDDGSSPN